MDKIDKLYNLAKLQNRENDLPDFILESILAVKNGDDKLIDELIEKVEFFNNEAGMGCFSDGYSLADIEKTLMKLGK